MKIELTVDDKPLVYEESFWAGKRKLTYCGQKLKRVNNKNLFLNPKAREKIRWNLTLTATYSRV